MAIEAELVWELDFDDLIKEFSSIFFRWLYFNWVVFYAIILQGMIIETCCLSHDMYIVLYMAGAKPNTPKMTVILCGHVLSGVVMCLMGRAPLFAHVCVGRGLWWEQQSCIWAPLCSVGRARATRVPRLCSGPGFDSRMGPFAACHSPSLTLFPITLFKLYYQ